jgi:uncharacterized protein YjiS (DUF1127 family)
MKRICMATVIATIITNSIASHVLAAGILGAATPAFLNLRSGACEYFSRLRVLFSGWIAAARAHRERRAAIFELSSLTDRELKDIGLYRSTIAHAPGSSERERQARISDGAPASPEANRRLR